MELIGPDPVVPDYAGPNVRGLIPALLGPRGWAVDAPAWMPADLASARQVVVFVLDGLGWDQFLDHRHLAPNLSAMTSRPIHTVAPTTTATALTSITTGLTPGEHGLIGYRIVAGGDVLNVLRWTVDGQEGRWIHRPADLQPFDPFMGHSVPIVSPAELQTTAFTEAHLRGTRPVGWRSATSIPVLARQELDAGQPVVYCYYGGVDKIAHERGFGPFYDIELQFADWLVGELLRAMPSGAMLLVTADHGQVEVGERIVHPSPTLLDGVTLQSGEGRFRWLHTAPGALADVAAAATEEVGKLGWVVTLDQLLDEGWFGPTVSAPVRARLGDVALLAREPVSFHDPHDSGPFELVCRHGSLTSAEVNVPLFSQLV